LNVDDEGVIDYTKIYTLLSRSEIEQLAREQQANPSARIAQKKLAEEVTRLVHGEDRLQSVQRVTKVLFAGETTASLHDEDIDVLAGEIPTGTVGKSVVESLIEVGMASSRGEARRLIDSGAISINSDKITKDQIITSLALLKRGKNSFALVR
jgi:tyrosyl-tRNA synthetase